MKTIVPVVTAAVLALALIPASAAPMHHKRHTKAATAAQPQIACTVVGCIPVPRGCHPEMGYTPGGTPTGFDVAVCPNYTLYGNQPLTETRGSPCPLLAQSGHRKQAEANRSVSLRSQQAIAFRCLRALV
ncbi:MAG TPA: hypothetical protein VFJ59_13025 [Pseudolabrys sp.]|nr:hypothetical protein [Pseudolabrys sp.]